MNKYSWYRLYVKDLNKIFEKFDVKKPKGRNRKVLEKCLAGTSKISTYDAYKAVFEMDINVIKRFRSIEPYHWVNLKNADEIAKKIDTGELCIYKHYALEKEEFNSLLKLLNLLNCSKWRNFPDYPFYDYECKIYSENCKIIGVHLSQHNDAGAFKYLDGRLVMAISKNIQRIFDILCQFKHLQKLYINTDYYSHRTEPLLIPEKISDLISLEFLDLSDNPIKNLPESIGNLKNLKILNLQKTLITELPKSLEKIPNLYIDGLDKTPLLEQSSKHDIDKLIERIKKKDVDFSIIEKHEIVYRALDDVNLRKLLQNILKEHHPLNMIISRKLSVQLHYNAKIFL